MERDPEAWLEKYVNRQLLGRSYDLICDEPIDNVLVFPAFTPVFCADLIEMIEAKPASAWRMDEGSLYAINEMWLVTLGLDDIYRRVMRDHILPLVVHRFALSSRWTTLTSMSTVIRYRADLEQHLDVHNDASFLSTLLTLNTDFDGGGTYYPKWKKLIRPEVPGTMLVHPGLLGYLHGGRPVTRGVRYLISSFIYEGERRPRL